VKHGLVAVCIPSYGDWKSAMAVSMVSMCMYSVTHGINTAIVSHSSCNVASGRNALVRRALEFCAEWILFCDADMTFPPEALERLLSARKDAIGVLYRRRIMPYIHVGEPLIEGHSPKSGIVQAKRLGCGFVLFRSSVFRRLPAPWFVHTWGSEADKSPSNVDGEISEDIGFMRNLRESGTPVWIDLDLSVMVGHVGEIIVTEASASSASVDDTANLAGFRRVG